eukprot:m.105498 g.105498  ORF g.105498 m.105498 type:complete len:95 (-) comp13279_c0_seq23:208-492(-)
MCVCMCVVLGHSLKFLHVPQSNQVRNAQAAGALGVIIVDDNQLTSTKNLFRMSGDGSRDIVIPSVFVLMQDVTPLLEAMMQGRSPFAKLHGEGE